MDPFLDPVLNPFLAFHSWLLGNNMTTIEFCEHSRGKGSVPQRGQGLGEAGEATGGVAGFGASRGSEPPAPVGGEGVETC